MSFSSSLYSNFVADKYYFVTVAYKFVAIVYEICRNSLCLSHCISVIYKHL